MVKTVWKTRNKICFEGKTVNNPIEIVCYACSLMRYWAGLYAKGDKERLVEGVNVMLKIAMKLISKTKAPGDTMMQI